MDKKVEKAIRVINEMLIYRGFHITDMPIYNIQANDSGFFHFVLRNAVAIVFIFDHNVSLNDDKSIIMKKVIPLLNFDEFDLILFVLNVQKGSFRELTKLSDCFALFKNSPNQLFLSPKLPVTPLDFPHVPVAP